MVRIITYIKHLFANRAQQEHYIHILRQMNLWEVDLLTLSDEIYLFQFLIDKNVLTLNDSFNNGRMINAQEYYQGLEPLHG